MTRRSTDPGGIRAFHNGECPHCGRPIVRAESFVFARRGEWIHIECKSGADDG